MTAIDIMQKRTGMSDNDAEFYEAMAEARIRSYLSLEDGADMSDYTFAIADIGALYYQMDTSSQTATASSGYASESFTEGSVSESHTLMTGASINSTYEDAILAVLESLGNTAGAYMVRFI